MRIQSIVNKRSSLVEILQSEDEDGEPLRSIEEQRTVHAKSTGEKKPPIAQSAWTKMENPGSPMSLIPTNMATNLRVFGIIVPCVFPMILILIPNEEGWVLARVGFVGIFFAVSAAIIVSHSLQVPLPQIATFTMSYVILLPIFYTLCDLLFTAEVIIIGMVALFATHMFSAGLFSVIFDKLSLRRLDGTMTSHRDFLFSMAALFFLYLQIVFTMAFGSFFATQPQLLRPILCAAFPLFIFTFKRVQQFFICQTKCEDALPLIEFCSLCWAAVPYRSIFLELPTWEGFLSVLVIELVAKLIAYPLQLTDKALEKKVELKLAMTGTNAFSVQNQADFVLQLQTMESYPEQSIATDLAREELTHKQMISKTLNGVAEKLFMHSVVDFAAAIGVVSTLLFDLFVHNPNQQQIQAFLAYNLWQYVIAIIWEIFITWVVWKACCKTSREFQSAFWVRGKILFETLFEDVFVFTILVYLILFFMMSGGLSITGVVSNS